ncbi:CbiX/SirB N-terminal domain-containing protein [Prosthecochloris sp. N3]|uniref:CbiX/SirB N-terminal domain-containing protein n=1 Tax=Prosthecochloris ethylica TaxID=2743976 RepID=A0ABR9XPV3_9CHLB|nr:CbiX/SirB N-terminal domain-containing protein [Prosthecochloris ethylica]MBF0586453.1 CbiX/SirB N-terminal domain-containing protein [Prosthecochloris ethylica]MBF0636066.1 CbiX/SirB N-terminal domain-containing protein [Prosthecochloris ethylica]NUK47797.1 CbiX/SirB N-terminal domain-containing protein [Prosthecochloris ethylica]
MHRLLTIAAFLAVLSLTALSACSAPDTTDNRQDSSSQNRKTGVLLVSHGSHSETWRNTLFALEDNVRERVLENGRVEGIKSAFMEYTEPSIATRLKEFDEEGYSDVIIVPILLTVSSHSFDDIPTIVGMKENPESVEMLKLEKIERYTPEAEVHITPLLDFQKILQENVLRRARALSKNPEEEGLALIGYGSEPYEEEWTQLFKAAADHVAAQTGIDTYSIGWCGHIVRYAPDSTTTAIERVLEAEKRAIVIPALVAFDENFQVRIIGGGIEKVDNHQERVLYKPDAILPDQGVEQWIVDISNEYSETIDQKK